MNQRFASRGSIAILGTTFLLLIMVLVSAVAGAEEEGLATASIDFRFLTPSQAGPVEFLIQFRDRPDLSAADRLSTKEAKGAFVYDTLRRTAMASQADVRRLLEERGVVYRPYWVNNMIWVRADRSLIQEVARYPEVLAIRANPAVRLDLPVDITSMRRSSEAIDDVLWNLALVNAPAVWASGYEGQGIVVGGQDTGYDWTHPGLQPRYRGWDGTTADHNYNWHDAIHSENLQNPNPNFSNPCGYNSVEPCDDGFHGTHTMGTMVGNDGQGTIVGMAPRAQWIGCRNMEEGWGTPATYTECFEWFIAPYPMGGDPMTDGDPTKAPHVINNSWSCPASEGCTPDMLQAVVEAVRTAGIVTVQSAGNSGSQCGSVDTPAAIYDASFTVGAVSSSGAIAGFSGRGPAPGGLLKPDIVAPGVSVTSTVPGNAFGELSGTSMASPHVAGLVALLLSADPSLVGDPDAIETTITQTAVGKTTTQGCGGDSAEDVPNNVYGWGFIDAAATVGPLGPMPYWIYTPFGALGVAP